MSEKDVLIPRVKYTSKVHCIVIELSLRVQTAFSVKVYRKTRNFSTILSLSQYAAAKSDSECCVAGSYI